MGPYSSRRSKPPYYRLHQATETQSRPPVKILFPNAPHVKEHFVTDGNFCLSGARTFVESVEPSRISAPVPPRLVISLAHALSADGADVLSRSLVHLGHFLPSSFSAMGRRRGMRWPLVSPRASVRFVEQRERWIAPDQALDQSQFHVGVTLESKSAR